MPEVQHSDSEKPPENTSGGLLTQENRDQKMCSTKFAQIYLFDPAGPSTHINTTFTEQFYFVISVFLGLKFLTEVCSGWSIDSPLQCSKNI